MAASSQHSERAEDRTSPARERDVLRAGGRAPIGAIVLVGALAAVFVYGIYLKSTSRRSADRTAAPPTSEPRPTGQGSATPGSSTMGHLERVPPESAAGRGRGAGILTTPEPELAQRPLIPESPGSPSAPAPGPAGASPQRPSPSAPSSTPPRPVSGAQSAPPRPASGSAPEPAPGAGSPPAEIDEQENDASSGEGSDTAQDPAGASDDGEGAGGEPTGDQATARPPVLGGGPGTPPPGTTTPGTPTTIPRTVPSPAPRGTAPAAAEQRAREGFRAHRYAESARLWKEWARSVPAGSYTVQIAAVQLDRPATSQALASLTGREGLFLLPPGPVTHDLAPVCVGVYPSIQDARSAAATTAPFPGSSSRPFPRRIDSLANGS